MINDFKVIVCASGGGGNFQTIIDNQKNIGYKIIKLICDRDCGAVKRALDNNIECVLIDKKNYTQEEFEKLYNDSIDADIDLIILAGYMSIVSDKTCNKWKNKIINTHPSLLPKYGGKGMYGVKVQEAVMKNKEEFAGCTIHYVSPEIDGGEIILQKKIKVDYNLTPWELGGQIFNEEGKLLIKAIQKIKSKSMI